MTSFTRTCVYLPIMIAVMLAIAMLPVRISLAESVTIENSVNSSASSGGNDASGGSVVEGGSRSTIEVRTVINGEVVEDYSNTEEGGDASQSYERTIESESGQPLVEIIAETALEAGLLENVPRADYPPSAPEEPVDESAPVLIGEIELVRPAFATSTITATSTFAETEDGESLKGFFKTLIDHVLSWAL